MNKVAIRQVSVDDSEEEDVPVYQWADARVLGTPPRGRLWVALGEGEHQREFMVDGRAIEAQFRDPRRPNEAWFAAVRNVVKPGQGAFVDRFFVRAVEHPRGTFDERMRLADAAAERRRKASDRPAQPVDLLADLPALRALEQRIEVLGGELPSERANGPGARLLRQGVHHVTLPALPAIRGPRALLEAVELEGDELSIVGGHLFHKTRTGKYREAVARAAPLIVGILAGRPIPCAFPHDDGATPEATTILAVDVPACEDCAP